MSDSARAEFDAIDAAATKIADPLTLDARLAVLDKEVRGLTGKGDEKALEANVLEAMALLRQRRKLGQK